MVYTMNMQLTITIFYVLYKYCRGVILLLMLQSTEMTFPNFLLVDIQQCERRKSKSSSLSLMYICVAAQSCFGNKLVIRTCSVPSVQKSCFHSLVVCETHCQFCASSDQSVIRISVNEFLVKFHLEWKQKLQRMCHFSPCSPLPPHPRKKAGTIFPSTKIEKLVQTYFSSESNVSCVFRFFL